MKYRYLGDSGLLVSRICLGTMTFGTEGWGCDEASSIAITNRFIEGGGNFIDTADLYAHGVSEEFLGKAIVNHNRDDLVIGSKCWFRMRPTPNAKGLSRKNIISALEASLKRLNTITSTSIRCTGPIHSRHLRSRCGRIDDLLKAGKVRYIGCSNFFGWQMVKANAIAKELGLTKLVSGQHLQLIASRYRTRNPARRCRSRNGNALLERRIAGGLLAGKYDQKSGPPKDSRVGQRANIDLPRYWNDESFSVIEEVKAIAKETGKTSAEVAMAWLLGDHRVTSVIVGAKRPEQVTEWLPVGDWDLPAELRERLTNVVPFFYGYPREWMETTFGNIAGGEDFARWDVRRAIEW